MRVRDRVLWVAVTSACVSGGCWAVWIVTSSAWALGLLFASHVGGAFLTASQLPSYRRPLAIALGLSVPVLGPVAAALATFVVGRGGAELLHDPYAGRATLDGREIARRLVGTLPICEALVSPDVEVTRQALTTLTARAAHTDIALLRWARTQCHGEAGVEVALACEEIAERFEQRATAARAAARTTPTYASLSAVFLVLVGGIASGIVDAALATRLASESCRYHDAAITLDPVQGLELLASRVWLELMLDRSVGALELLGAAQLVVGSDPEMCLLLREAAYAARRFDLALGPEHADA